MPLTHSVRRQRAAGGARPRFRIRRRLNLLLLPMLPPLTDAEARGRGGVHNAADDRSAGDACNSDPP
eukprot:2301367-Alexandrium_andersonii.AAC.1